MSAWHGKECIMCAGSNAKIGETEIEVYMGYYGGSLYIGDKAYHQIMTTGENVLSREEAIRLLTAYGAEALAVLLVDLIDNSEE